MRFIVPSLVLTFAFGNYAALAQSVEIAKSGNSYQISIDRKPVARFVVSDPKILRPYFAEVRAPNGIQVTRNHPPKDKDATDHDSMHPGIWMGFGDLGGSDFWRNKGSVRTEVLDEKRTDCISARNQYLDGKKPICEEVFHVQIRIVPAGYLLLLDSTFQSATPFAFGDQEEMGLGIRVATPLTVKNGGEILNSDGRKNEKETWGKAADWCAYGGKIDGKAVGMAIYPHPDNFRKSWFHARDYGLLVANPFGQKAFTRGEASKFVVRKDEPFRLRFGILIFGSDTERPPDFDKVYKDYLQFAKDERK